MKEKRWVEIASSIKNAIRRGELSSGARIASETRLAGDWDVSTATVHRALAELQREGWVARRPGAGTVVCERAIIPATSIAIIADTVADGPQCDYISGIEESLAGKYQVRLLCSRRNGFDEERCLRQAAQECDGIICIPICCPENTPLLNEIAASLPLLLLDRVPADVAVDAFMTDNYQSMLMGLRHLHSIGHTRIAYFMEDSLHISSVFERHAAYRDFMSRDLGAADPAAWERRFNGGSLTPARYVAAAGAALADLLAGRAAITAVACQHDATLEAVLEACAYLRVRVDEDLAILSFNDNARRIPYTGVHRLVQRSVEMGHMAALRMQHRLNSVMPSPPALVTRITTDLYLPFAPEPAAGGAQLAARRLQSSDVC